jgi:hypothetical protein
MTKRSRTFQCPPDHAHGANLNCYNSHSCGCDSCLNLNRTYTADVRKQRAYGRFDGEHVDGAAVREHLAYLLEQGIGAPTVSRLTGISTRTIQGIRQDRSPRVVSRNAAAILAIHPTFDLLAGGAFVPSRGVRRRLQALIAAGWTQTRIAAEYGDRPTQTVNQLLHGTDKVTARTFRDISAMYDRLSATPAPREGAARYAYVRAVRLAARNHWVTPLAWDDIDNDPQPPVADAQETVDLVAVELAVSGRRVRLNHAERLEGLRRMHLLKWSNPLIAQRLGCEPRTVNRLRVEIGLPGWDQTEIVGWRAA